MGYRVILPPISRSIERKGDTEAGTHCEAKGPFPLKKAETTETAETNLPASDPGDVDLAMRIATFLETLSEHQSATASEIAERFYGADYTLNQILEVYRICEILRSDRLLIRAREGYGYQLCCSAKR
jgi:hypothetical protein